MKNVRETVGCLLFVACVVSVQASAPGRLSASDAKPRTASQLITSLQGGTEELTRQSFLVSRLGARIEATSELIAEIIRSVGELNILKSFADELTELGERLQQAAILIAAVSEDQKNRIQALDETDKSDEERQLAARTIGQAEQALDAARLSLALSP